MTMNKEIRSLWYIITSGFSMCLLLIHCIGSWKLYHDFHSSCPCRRLFVLLFFPLCMPHIQFYCLLFLSTVWWLILIPIKISLQFIFLFSYSSQFALLSCISVFCVGRLNPYNTPLCDALMLVKCLHLSSLHLREWIKAKRNVLSKDRMISTHCDLFAIFHKLKWNMICWTFHA